MTDSPDPLPTDQDAAPEAPESPEDLYTRAAFAVDGVTDVFAPTTIAHVPQIVAALVTGQSERLNRVAVSTAGDGVAIDARIGVDAAAGAAEAARAVADALLELAPAEGETTVAVQVSRIA